MKCIRRFSLRKSKVGMVLLFLWIVFGRGKIEAETIYDKADCPEGYHINMEQKEVCDHTGDKNRASIRIQNVTDPMQMSKNPEIVKNACVIQKAENVSHPFVCAFRITTEDIKDMEGAEKISPDALHVVINQNAFLDWSVAYPCTRKFSRIANYAYVNYEFVWCEKIKDWYRIRSEHSFLYDAGLDGPAQKDEHEWMQHEVKAYHTQANRYHIRYEANDGSDQSVQQNAQYEKDVKLKKQIFSRKGYRLCGWSLQPDAYGQEMWKPGEIVKNLTTDDGKTITLYAQWQKIYKIKYKINANGKHGTVPLGQKKYETVSCRLTLEPAVVTDLEWQALYRFRGWSVTKDGSAGMWTQQDYKEEADLTLYAQWDTSFYVIYQSGGADRGRRYEEKVEEAIKPYCLQKNEAYTKFYKEGTYENLSMTVPCRFMGWGLKEEGESVYEEGSICKGEEIYRSYTKENGVKYYKDIPCVRLYAIWDWTPVLNAKDRYMTLAQAQRGEITEEELKRTGIAWDHEEGKFDSGAIELPDYQSSDFTDLKHEAVISVRYQVMDQAKNQAEKQIFVHIVDTLPDRKGYVATENLQKLRFLCQEDQSYEQKFEKRSKWRTQRSYQEVLQKLQEKGTGEIYEFTEEEVHKMHAFLEKQPPDKLITAKQLEKFYQMFCVKNQK